MSTLYVDTINEKTSGNGVYIPGHVVQVKHQEFATTTQINTQSAWVDTGLTQSITVNQGSKILANCDLCSGQLNGASNMGMYIRLLEGSNVFSSQHIEEHSGVYTLNNSHIRGLTSALNAGTYTVKCQVYVLPVGSAFFRFNWTGVGESHFTLEEIAQ